MGGKRKLRPVPQKYRRGYLQLLRREDCRYAYAREQVALYQDLDAHVGTFARAGVVKAELAESFVHICGWLWQFRARERAGNPGASIHTCFAAVDRQIRLGEKLGIPRAVMDTRPLTQQLVEDESGESST
jgi:hypothetical protein